MSHLKFVPHGLPGMVLIEPFKAGDSRGFFMETFQKAEFERAGLPVDFVQDNHSGSHGGILRGLHYQIKHPQGKLVRVVIGEVFDVVVDLRKYSPTFGQWSGIRLSAQSPMVLWIPPGFAHGFYVVSDWAEFVYKTTDYYAPEWERTILWNDPTLAIDWHIPDGISPILSTKDAAGSAFHEADVYQEILEQP